VSAEIYINVLELLENAITEDMLGTDQNPREIFEEMFSRIERSNCKCTECGVWNEYNWCAKCLK